MTDAPAPLPQTRAGRGPADAPPTPLARAEGRVLRLVDRAGWAVLGLLLLAIAYLVAWQRGYYLDDYANRAHVVDPVTGRHTPIWQPAHIPGFPVRALAWAVNRQLAVWLDRHELAVRASAAAFCGANGLLLGWLAWRLLRSRVAALLCAWMFLAPFQAHEATLWAGAASYVLTATLMLLSLHALLSAVRANRRRDAGLWALVGALPCGVSLLFFEQPALLLALVPFAALVQPREPRGGDEASALRDRAAQRGARRRGFVRALCILAAFSVAAALYGASFYPQNALVAGRGGIDLSALGFFGRAQEHFSRLGWMIAGTWGFNLSQDVFGVGSRRLLGTWGGVALAWGALASVLLTTLAYLGCGSRSVPASDAIGPAAREGAYVFLGAALAFVATLLIPASLVADQILEYRMLYLPYAAACLALGSLAAALERAAGRVAGALLVGLAGLAALGNSVCTLGHADAYAQRYAADLYQTEGLRAAIQPERVPPGAIFAPLLLDRALYGRDDAISALMHGVFEMPASGQAAVQRICQRSDVRAIATTHWIGVRVEPAAESALSSQPALLRWQGQEALVEKLIPFTQFEHRLALLDTLVLVGPGQQTRTLRFPAVSRARSASAQLVEVTLLASEPNYKPVRVRLVEPAEGSDRP